MGCSIPKEKIEDEIMKMKMQRIIVQMERVKQLELLKEIDGIKRNVPIIPDYIDQGIINNKAVNNSQQTINHKQRKRRMKSNRSKSSKSCLFKRKNDLFNLNEEGKDHPSNIKKKKRNKTNIKIMKY